MNQPVTGCTVAGMRTDLVYPFADLTGLAAWCRRVGIHGAIGPATVLRWRPGREGFHLVGCVGTDGTEALCGDPGTGTVLDAAVVQLPEPGPCPHCLLATGTAEHPIGDRSGLPGLADFEPAGDGPGWQATFLAAALFRLSQRYVVLAALRQTPTDADRDIARFVLSHLEQPGALDIASTTAAYLHRAARDVLSAPWRRWG